MSDRLREVFEDALNRHLRETEKVERDGFAYIQCGCESPIEELLAAALYFSTVWGERMRIAQPGLRIGLPAVRESLLEQFRRAYSDVLVVCYPQFHFSGYRLDFLIGAVIPPTAVQFIAIECDGHEFHEKTKEQAARDKRRDRALVAQGMQVMRFTGSEIFHSPAECVRELTEMLDRMADDGVLR